MADQDIFEWKGFFLHDNGRPAVITQAYQCINEGSASGNAEHLNDVVRNALEVLLPGLMNPIWTPGITVCQNLTDTDDYDEGSWAFTPGLGANPLPSFNAVGIRSPKQKFGYNRGRHNLPLGDASWLDANGTLVEAAREAVEGVCNFFGNTAVAASTGEQWRPVTIAKEYTNKVLTGVSVRSDLRGLWQYDVQFTTVKSRQSYFWDDID